MCGALKGKMPILTQLISLWKVSGLIVFPSKWFKSTFKPKKFQSEITWIKGRHFCGIKQWLPSYYTVFDRYWLFCCERTGFLCSDISFDNTIHYRSNQRRSESRMELYSNEEMADMRLMYGKANGNGREAVRLYSERYQNRRIPNHKLFANLHDYAKVDRSE